jgi:hypothetical protein
MIASHKLKPELFSVAAETDAPEREAMPIGMLDIVGAHHGSEVRAFVRYANEVPGARSVLDVAHAASPPVKWRRRTDFEPVHKNPHFVSGIARMSAQR